MSTGIRLGPLSARWRPRHLLVVIGVVVATLTVAVVSIGTGDFSISPGRVLEVLLHGGTRQEELIIDRIRLPRVLVGIVVGIALGLSGAIVQTTARNALASPDLLGVTAGASVGAVAVIVLGGESGRVSGLLDTVGVPVAAQIGGLVAALAVLAVLRRTGSAGLQPILVGVGVTALLGGFVSWMLVQASIDDAARANIWLTGSLNGRSWTQLWMLLLVLAVAVPLLAPLSARLPALDLGTDLASGLGFSVVRSQAALLGVAVLLASATTAAAGPVAFVALVSPHVARMACGASRPPLIGSAVVGALLVSVSDLAARMLFAPVQLPVGAVTAVIGAPFLLWLLIRSRREAAR